jgi:hypothetical protein
MNTMKRIKFNNVKFFFFNKFILAICGVVASLNFNICLANDGSKQENYSKHEEKNIELQIKLMENNIELQKNIINNSIENSDKRLADFGALATMQGSHTAWVGNLVAIVSIGITILVFGAGFLTYISTKARAIKEAKQAVEDWFEKNTADLRMQIDELRSEVKIARLQIKELIENVKKRANEASKFFDEHKKKIDEDYQTFGKRNRSAEKNKNNFNTMQPQAENDDQQNSFESFFKKGLEDYRESKFQESLSSFNSAEKLSDDVPLEKLIRLLLAKQIALRNLNRHAESLGVHSDILSRTRISNEPEIRFLLAESFLNKANTFSALERAQEELDAYDEILTLFGEDSSINVKASVSRALINKGVALSNLGRAKDEIKNYNILIEKFQNINDSKMRERISRALLYKGITHGQLNEYEDELTCYSRVVQDYSKDDESVTRENVARALIQKALRLSALERNVEALKIYEEIERKYRNNSTEFYLEAIAKSRLGWGVVLSKLGRHEEEIEKFQKIEDQFIKDPSAQYMRPITSNAMVLKSLTLIILERYDEAKRVLQQILSRFGSDEKNSVQENVINARNILENLKNGGSKNPDELP